MYNTCKLGSFFLLVDKKPCVSLIVHLLNGELMLNAFANRQLTFS